MRTGKSGDSYYTADGGDQYTGLDRFGRVIDQFWTIPTGPTTTDRFQYAYDRDSNALYKNNLKISTLSELYHANSAASGDNATAYDGFNRLGNFIRGTLSASTNNGASGQGSLDTVTTASGLSTHAETWSLDALGNWTSQTIDGGTAVSRTHNSQNEVTAITGLTSPTFDYNGNTTTDQAGSTYIYDAWNRLISVTSSGSTLLATYVYDTRGRRIQEVHGGTTTDLYYSSQWQVIEERQSTTITNQYVWSLAYIDGLVLRDDNSSSGNLGISGSGLGERLYAQQDANWNTTALIDTGGTVQERFVYDPYGNAEVLTISGTSTTDGYNWNYLHQGGRLDPTTGLYIFRHRDYSPTLGRWMEQDPFGARYIDGKDLYEYVRSSPENLNDPSGLGSFDFLNPYSLPPECDPWKPFDQDPPTPFAKRLLSEFKPVQDNGWPWPFNSHHEISTVDFELPVNVQYPDITISIVAVGNRPDSTSASPDDWPILTLPGITQQAIMPMNSNIQDAARNAHKDLTGYPCRKMMVWRKQCSRCCQNVKLSSLKSGQISRGEKYTENVLLEIPVNDPSSNSGPGWVRGTIIPDHLSGRDWACDVSKNPVLSKPPTPGAVCQKGVPANDKGY